MHDLHGHEPDVRALPPLSAPDAHSITFAAQDDAPGRVETVTKRVLRRVVPASGREFIHRIRRVGLRKAVAYRRLEHGRPRPVAGEPFGLGDGHAFVVPESVVHAVASHWTDYGHSIRELEAFKRIRRGCSTFLDIGAAEGIFSAAFCALGSGTAWAFEPSPVMQERLQEVRAANPGLDIRLQEVALGESAGSLAVRRYSDGQFSAAGEGKQSSMAVTTLDGFAREHGVRPDLVKIDVEGMELAVLRGAGDALAEVKHILLEVHYGLFSPREQQTAELQRLVESLGLRLFTLEGRTIPDLHRYTEAEPEVIPGYTIVVCSRDGAHT